MQHNYGADDRPMLNKYRAGKNFTPEEKAKWAAMGIEINWLLVEHEDE